MHSRVAPFVRGCWRDRREAEVLAVAAEEEFARLEAERMAEERMAEDEWDSDDYDSDELPDYDEHYLWRETVQRARTQGYLLFEIHRRPVRRRMDLLSRIPKKRRCRS